MLTLPSLYILNVFLYIRYKCVLTHIIYVYENDFRGRDVLRLRQQRTVLYIQLPPQVCVKIIKHLPRQLKFKMMKSPPELALCRRMLFTHFENLWLIGFSKGYINK